MAGITPQPAAPAAAPPQPPAAGATPPAPTSQQAQPVAGATPPAPPALPLRNRGSFADILRGSARPGKPLVIPQQPAAATPPEPPVAPAPVTPSGARTVAPAASPPASGATSPASPPAAPEPLVIGAGGRALSGEALELRLTRERSKIYREVFGTSDPAKVKLLMEQQRQQLSEYETLHTAEEQRRREAMTREEQLNADLAAANARAEAAEARVADMETGTVVNSQTEELRGIAAKYLKAPVIRYALLDFQAYLKSLTPDQLKIQTPRAIERWFRKFGEDNPDFMVGDAVPPAAGASAGTPPAPVSSPVVQRPPVRRPVQTSTAPKGGTGTPRPLPPDPSTHAGKTVRPGLPNSMNKQELNAHLKSKGLRSWS